MLEYCFIHSADWARIIRVPFGPEDAILDAVQTKSEEGWELVSVAPAQTAAGLIAFLKREKAVS